MINVVCVLRQGGKVGYDYQWVEKLKKSIERNLSYEHKFICLSDCEVPCDRIELISESTGFWAKMELFRPNLFTGPVLYIDLDTVICDNIDPIVDLCKDKSFVMWYEEDKNIDSSAMMYWNGDYSYLWNLYKSQPLEYWKSLYAAPPLYGDQALISENTKHDLFTNMCPKEWFHIASKKDEKLDLSKIKLLMFRKTKSKPSTMLDHPVVKQHWN